MPKTLIYDDGTEFTFDDRQNVSSFIVKINKILNNESLLNLMLRLSLKGYLRGDLSEALKNHASPEQLELIQAELYL